MFLLYILDQESHESIESREKNFNFTSVNNSSSPEPGPSKKFRNSKFYSKNNLSPNSKSSDKSTKTIKSIQSI